MYVRTYGRSQAMKYRNTWLVITEFGFGTDHACTVHAYPLTDEETKILLKEENRPFIYLFIYLALIVPLNGKKYIMNWVGMLSKRKRLCPHKLAA